MIWVVTRIAAICAAVLAVGAVAAAASESRARGLAASPCEPPHQPGPGVSEWINDSPTMPPTTGDLRMAMLFVDFPDAPGIGDPQTIHDLFAPGVADWITTVSYGKLRLHIEPLPRWLRLPRSSAAYAAAGHEGLVAAVADAVALADPAFDFGGFHGTYIIPSRDHKLGILGVRLHGPDPIRVDGTELKADAWVFNDAITPADAQFATAYAIHETIHVLGLPDLSLPPSLSTLNHWDAAATGGMKGVAGGMYAWHRWILGWLDDAQIACLRGRGTRVATVTPLARPGGVKALVVRAGNFAYIAEVRRRLAEDGRICRSGVLLTSVNLLSPYRGGPSRGALQVVPARVDDLKRWQRCGGHWNATFGIGRGEISRVTLLGKIQFRVLAALPDGSYRLSVTQRR